VRLILAGAEDGLDLAGGGIKYAERLGTFGGKPELLAVDIQSVRSAQRRYVDGGQGLTRDEINDGKGVEGAFAVI
jgi:hypothetical protein